MDYIFEATLTDAEFADYAAHMDKYAPGWRERTRALAIRELEAMYDLPFLFDADYLDRQLDVFGRIQGDRESAGVW